MRYFASTITEVGAVAECRLLGTEYSCFMLRWVLFGFKACNSLFPNFLKVLGHAGWLLYLNFEKTVFTNCSMSVFERSEELKEGNT